MSSKVTKVENSKDVQIDINIVIPKLATRIAKLDSGSKAALRRGPYAGAGAAVFWQILAKYDIKEYHEKSWATIVQAIAILTHKGSSASSAYKPTTSFGSALYRAKVSELRLANLLSATPELRHSLVIRLCRRLIAADQSAFDLRTLVQFILFRQEYTDRKIARDFYRTERLEKHSESN